MSQELGKILIVDDEKPIRDVLSASLMDEGFQVIAAANGEEGLQEVGRSRPHVVLLDVWMPGGMDGVEMMQKARGLYPEVDFIVMSGHGNIETAVRATKLGAWDFVEKPLSIEKIQILLHNVLSFQQERSERRALLSRLRENVAIVGDSEPMKSVKAALGQLAQNRSPVVISGEVGTGKKLIARNLHYLSARASGPFIELNVSSVPEELLESELFGFERGAFVGPTRSRRGRLQLAEGGTLMLSGLHLLSPTWVDRIRSVVDSGMYMRPAADQPISTNVRWMFTSERETPWPDVSVLALPPLRERAMDVVPLINHFAESFAREGSYRRKFFSDEATERMRNYPWPGNVRELRNFVERLYILTPGDLVHLPDLDAAGFPKSHAAWDETLSFRDARAQFERDYILKKIAENNGNISRTAESIGLERSYLHRKIKTYGIETGDLL